MESGDEVDGVGSGGAGVLPGTGADASPSSGTGVKAGDSGRQERDPSRGSVYTRSRLRAPVMSDVGRLEHEREVAEVSRKG